MSYVYDQDDVEDCSQQVSYMTYFTSCQRVVVWLCEPTGETQAGLEFIRDTCALIVDRRSQLPDVGGDELNERIIRDVFPAADPSHWLSMIVFLRDPWWK